MELVRGCQDIYAFVQIPGPSLRVRKSLGDGVVFVKSDEAVPGLDVTVIPGCILDGAVCVVESGMGDDFCWDVEAEVS